MPTLTLFHRGLPILREELESSLTIGSHPQNDVCLLDGIEPQHARLEMTEEGLILMERDGPVYLNGRPIRGSDLVKAGDLFDIGAYRFQVTNSPAASRREKTATASLQERTSASPIPILHFLQPTKKKFRRSRLLIGRSEGCDVVLDNPFVSSQHAELFVRDGDYYLRDLHSRNGTFLNDFRVTERILPPAGAIRLGRCSLTYEIEKSSPEKAEEIPGIPLAPMRPGAPARLIVGKSRALRELTDRLKKIAPTDDTVLLLGETGVGKDLLAQYLHTENPKRRNFPFVVVNCATIPQTLADSQLFGHLKGAFSGAVGDHPGFFQQAHRGTLFLDEIGELPMESQARLLRILEDGTVRPVGGTRETAVDVRVVFATNRNLDQARYAGDFREDLFQRFDWILRVPALRERLEDLPFLVRHFLAGHSHTPLTLSGGVTEILRKLPWRGNIRELNRLTRRAITNALGRGATEIGLADFDLSELAEGTERPSATEARQSKREALAATLTKHKGNVTRSAKELGISRVTIHNWIKSGGINLEEFRNA